MPAKVELNHLIIHARDKKESAFFLSKLFELEEPKPFGPFLVVRMTNGVSLDYVETDEDIKSQHYAFLVSQKKWDMIFEKIKNRKMQYWADPQREKPGRINTNDGGCGVYFEDPSGHFMEIMTVPYSGH